MATFETLKVIDVPASIVAELNVQTLFSIFQFNGYDPVTTFEELKKRARQAGVDVRTFIKDMQEIIVWFCMRGARFDPRGGGKQASRSAARTTEQGKAEIMRVCQKYNIVDAQPNASTDINIARVIGVFAYQTAGVFVQFPDKMRKVVETEKYSLPRWACFPQAASLLLDTQLENFYAWSAEFDATIKSQVPGYRSDVANVKKYVDIAFNSNLYPKDQRARLQQNLASMTR